MNKRKIKCWVCGASVDYTWNIEGYEVCERCKNGYRKELTDRYKEMMK